MQAVCAFRSRTSARRHRCTRTRSALTDRTHVSPVQPASQPPWSAGPALAPHRRASDAAEDEPVAACGVASASPIATNPYGHDAATGTGTALSVVELLPSWPRPFEPQHWTPPPTSAQV